MPGLRASKLLAFLFLTISVIACSTAAPGPIQPRVAPAATPTALATEAPNFVTPKPQATPTALATEAPNLVTPRPQAKATAKPTKQPASGSFYKPAGWDGTSDVDCPDFDTHAHAQSFFLGTGGSTTHDPYRLDADHDGSACETRP